MNRMGFPHWLALVFCVYFAVLAIDPVSREVWIAEIIPVVLDGKSVVLDQAENRLHAQKALLAWLLEVEA